MRLLRLYLRRERETLMENRIRLKAIGRLEDLPRFARTTLEETIALTAGNDGMVLRLALSYGGRTEMADAARALARDVAAGRVGAEDIDDETLRGYLYDSETPDPDLLIRTAGEMRLSNFLLWQASYAELYVTEECWPEFRRPQLLGAIKAFAGRKRKFGGLLRVTELRWGSSGSPPRPRHVSGSGESLRRISRAAPQDPAPDQGRRESRRGGGDGPLRVVVPVRG